MTRTTFEDRFGKFVVDRYLSKTYELPTLDTGSQILSDFIDCRQRRVFVILDFLRVIVFSLISKQSILSAKLL